VWNGMEVACAPWDAGQSRGILAPVRAVTEGGSRAGGVWSGWGCLESGWYLTLSLCVSLSLSLSRLTGLKLDPSIHTVHSHPAPRWGGNRLRGAAVKLIAPGCPPAPSPVPHLTLHGILLLSAASLELARSLTRSPLPRSVLPPPSGYINGQLMEGGAFLQGVWDCFSLPPPPTCPPLQQAERSESTGRGGIFCSA